jgi:NAD(P)-dependent dehydrogenase (short-subunit alcohol dehydrogenase family)
VDVSLDGKVALVTGAGPNIGSGIALALARYGARVACNDLDLDAAKAAAARVVVSRYGPLSMGLMASIMTSRPAAAAWSAAQA